MENVSGSPTGTGDLTGATSGATYTPTATSVQTSADQDLNNGAGVQPYNFFIGHAARSPAEIYEYGKYITRYGSVTALFTLNGDDGQEYRSANEGTYSEVKKAPYGTLAGTTFYGATGVWMDAYSVADFVLLDANLATQSPPDYQKAVASHDDLDGSVSTLGGVQLFVSEITGSGGTYVTPYTFDQAGSTANTIRANEAIDINKTPQTGTVRIGDTEYAYTGLNTATDDFTGVTPDPTGESNAAAFSVPLISLLADADTEQSDNIIYSTPFWCRIVARRWGTKPYTVDAQFGANGLNFSPILSTDPQAKP
ncbi:MAG: hypothetical protein GQ570_04005 [Helicobacteraceae bacterium]|nr:hypothetical protein [Helicobacteraceae bacterium]